MPIYAICPFFMCEKKNLIACEEGRLRFPNHTKKRTLSKKFCETFDYKTCKRYQRTLEKYEQMSKRR